MVIEGIITTENSDGSMHIAPIGPHVDEGLTKWTLKPFQSSTTFANLRATSRGVFHVVDDALLMAAAVLGLCNQDLRTICNPSVPMELLEGMARAEKTPEVGWALERSSRIFGLRVMEWNTSEPRAVAQCELILRREQNPMWGWNRAKHSILELSVIASRVHILEKREIEAEFARHKSIIDKTAGPRELAAWHLLYQRVVLSEST